MGVTHKTSTTSLVRTSGPGLRITRARSGSFELLAYQTPQLAHIEVCRNSDAFVYQLTVKEQRLYASYNAPKSKHFRAVYLPTATCWRLEAGDRGAPRTNAGLRDLWPLEKQPTYFVDLLRSSDVPQPTAPTALPIMPPPVPPPPSQPNGSYAPKSDLEKDFLAAFIKACKQHDSEIWSVTHGDFGNFIVFFSGGILGDGCVAWLLWMLEWLNASGWSAKRVVFEPVWYGNWPWIHQLIRVRFPDGRTILVDPWRDPCNPAWEEEDYPRLGPLYPGPYR